MTTYLALESRYQLAVLRENREVEIVVVVSNSNFPSSVDSDSNGIVCDTWERKFRYKSNIKYDSINLESYDQYSHLSRNFVSYLSNFQTLTFSSNLPDEVPFIVKHLDTVGPVVADEDLLSVIDNNPVGELQML